MLLRRRGDPEREPSAIATEGRGERVPEMKLRAAVLLSSLVVLGWVAGRAVAQSGPIMPLSQVTPGMNCTGYSVVQGTTISWFNVLVIAVVDGAAPGGGPGILTRVSGPAVAAAGVAEGFSGTWARPAWARSSPSSRTEL